MAYYEIAKLRERCVGSSTDTSQDTLLNNFGAQADSQIDDEIYNVAQRNAKLSSLPALPLTSPTQTIKDASTDRATSLFWRQQHEVDMADRYMQASKEAVRAFVIRLESDAQNYGMIF